MRQANILKSLTALVAVVMLCMITADSFSCCMACRKKAAEHIHKKDEFDPENCPACAANKGALCAQHKIRKSDCAHCKKCLNDPVLSTGALQVLMMSGTKMTMLDARDAESYAKMHIPGAKNVMPKASEEEIKKAVKKKDMLVVVYCGGLKCPLSHRLAGRLHDLGYHNVLEYSYGIECWLATGNAVEGTEADAQTGSEHTGSQPKGSRHK